MNRLNAGLHAGPTKAEELEHWREFLNTLPTPCYLSLFLDGSAEVLADYMKQDISTELIPALRRGRQEAQQAEADALTAKAKALEELATVQRELAAARKALCDIRNEMREHADAAQAIARTTAEAHRELAHRIAFNMGKK